MDPYVLTGTWLATILTLMILTFLIKENVFFRIAEIICVSTMTANTFIIGLTSIQRSVVKPFLEGQIEYLLLIILGISLYLRFWKKYDWITRYAMGMILGIGVGLMLSTIVGAQIIGQIKASVGPPTLENILFWALTISTLSFFIFHKEFKGLPGTFLKNLRTVGRWALMLMASVMLGASVTTRIDLVVGIVNSFRDTLMTIL
jgi:hypothetical protein